MLFKEKKLHIFVAIANFEAHVLSTALITPAMKSACQFDTNSCAYYGDVLDFFSYTITPQTLVEAMLRLSTVARLNAYCNLNRDQCPNLLINDAGFDAERCCGECLDFVFIYLTLFHKKADFFHQSTDRVESSTKCKITISQSTYISLAGSPCNMPLTQWLGLCLYKSLLFIFRL